MVPAGIIGLAFEEQIRALLVAFAHEATLTITGLLLFMADGARDTNKELNWVDALIVGLAQAVVILLVFREATRPLLLQ